MEDPKERQMTDQQPVADPEVIPAVPVLLPEEPADDVVTEEEEDEDLPER